MNKLKKYLSIFILTLYLTVQGNVDALQGPLSTEGNQIVNREGCAVRIQGVSWFGFESTNYVPHGLWTRSWQSMMDQIKELGFNTIRIPFCNQMFDANSRPNSINDYENPDLVGLSSIEILDKIVAYADKIGLALILDHHRSDGGMGALNNGLWHTEAYPESRFIQDWQMLASRYKNNPSVIGADLHNEPHASASWGTGDYATDWQAAAERTGNAIHAINPDWLIIVEGIEFYQNKNYWWGGNLMGVRNKPVVLNIPNKLVYSPHDYPNSIYNQPWFNDANYPSNLNDHFRNAWGYLFETNVAPIIIGEFGSKFKEEKDFGWMKQICGYLNGDFQGTGRSELAGNQAGASWIWWSWNPNSGDTGGILLDDWRTADSTKLQFLKPIMSK